MSEPILRSVIDAVARYYAVDPKALLSRDRSKSLVIARQSGMYVSRMVGNFSYTEIGEVFKREHTTVMAAVQSVTRRTLTDPLLKAALDDIARDFQSSPATGKPVRVRSELVDRLDAQVKQGVYGKSVEDLVDRILCDYFRREQSQK